MKQAILAILCILVLIMTASGCNSQTGGEAPAARVDKAMTITDDADRQVTLDTTIKRVGIASGSLAEIWQLAGGDITAVTRDGISDERLTLPQDVIDLGSLENPSTETILSSNLDLLILSANLKGHLAIADTLEQAGVNFIYLDIETFDDYLRALKMFTDVTVQPDLLAKNGDEVKEKIDAVIAQNKRDDSPKVLVLRISPSSIKARNSETMVGQMLSDLGAVNIADDDEAILKDLSMEAIAEQDPDYIFVVTQGEPEEAKANLENLISSNPIWNTLSAVSNGKVYYLEKELFQYKPNARWAQSYEVLADILKEG